MEKLKFQLLPHLARILYIDDGHNLYETNFWIWGYWGFWRGERMICNVDKLLGLLYNIVPEGEAKWDDSFKPVKPVLH